MKTVRATPAKMIQVIPVRVVQIARARTIRSLLMTMPDQQATTFFQSPWSMSIVVARLLQRAHTKSTSASFQTFGHCAGMAEKPDRGERKHASGLHARFPVMAMSILRTIRTIWYELHANALLPVHQPHPVVDGAPRRHQLASHTWICSETDASRSETFPFHATWRPGSPQSSPRLSIWRLH